MMTVRQQIIAVAAERLLARHYVGDPKVAARETVEWLASRHPEAEAYLNELGWKGYSYEQLLGRIISKARLR